MWTVTGNWACMPDYSVVFLFLNVFNFSAIALNAAGISLFFSVWTNGDVFMKKAVDLEWLFTPFHGHIAGFFQLIFGADCLCSGCPDKDPIWKGMFLHSISCSDQIAQDIKFYRLAAHITYHCHPVLMAMPITHGPARFRRSALLTNSTISPATLAALSSWPGLSFTSIKTASTPSPRYLAIPLFLNMICVTC